MKIYWIKSQAPRRVLALIKHLDLEAEFVEVDMMNGEFNTPDYLRMNPNAKAPTLVDGDLTLWESSAIMTYLCIKTGSEMWPAKAPIEQVEVLRWLSWNDCHWSPAVGSFYFEHIVKPGFRMGEPDLPLLKTKTPEFIKFARVLDAHLTDRRYVACDRLTIADFQLASMATDWREAEMPLQGFPNIVNWLDRLMRIPAWAEPWPTTTLSPTIAAN